MPDIQPPPSTGICIAGLGKLGAPMAACIAAKGFRVTGVDPDPGKVASIRNGLAPVTEPGLQALMERARSCLTASTDYAEAVPSSEISFIVVPTPSTSDGGFSTGFVLQAAAGIGEAMRKREGYHLVVLTSTVLPGVTGGELLPLLERSSGKRCGPDFGLCYNPEFIALGTVIHDLYHPDFVLVGESDADAGDRLAAFYARFCESRPPIARMNFINAELCKLSVNTFVTTKISYANMLTELCERLPGADVDRVTSALGLDSRIGPKYLRGGMGFGGPCFPRDNAAFLSLARGLGAPAPLAEATERVNLRQEERLLDQVLSRLPPEGAVGILGLAYKPCTDVVEASPGISLARALIARGVRTVCYDPLATAPARKVLGDGTDFASSAEDCLARAAVAVLAMPCPEFRSLRPEDLTRGKGPRLVLLDCWRMLDRARFEPCVDYVPLGVG